MQCKSPDTRIYGELTSLNAGLLRILVWQDGPDAPGAPRLAPTIAIQLRQLTRDELAFIAGTPALLAGFVPPAEANRADGVADSDVPGNHYVPSAQSAITAGAPRLPGDSWLRLTRVFTAALLTWLWKSDQHDELFRALCLGYGEKLPPFSVRLIESLATDAAPRLCVRFAGHPRFWPDLVVAARSEDPQLRALSRLSVIPLVLAEDRASQ
ncbi:MAG: hypothetical protein KJO76_01400 [Gammaproteobacteria bacterium]|nr:hypothetical protein [Gammaproteobacteria bacterium]